MAMNWCGRLLATSFAIALSGSPAWAQQAVGDWQGVLHASEQALRDPGDAAIGVALDRRIAQRAGVGMVAGIIDAGESRVVARGPVGAPGFDADTLIEIASLTKLFTALLLADMVLKGEVSLDDPAETYLPAGATMPARGGRQITLRDLSMHVSGLPRLPDNMVHADPADPYAAYTERDLLNFLRDHELARDAGSRAEYSNLGVGLLGYLLGRAAGREYADLLRERITGPLGMEDTAIALSPAQQARFAPGHDADLQPAPPWHFAALAGAGALRSTMADMLIFAAAALDPQSPIADAMALTLEPRAALGPQADFALGWMVAKPPGMELLLHSGGTGGHRSSIALDPAGGRGVVVLTNSAVEPSTEDVALHLLAGAPLAPSARRP